MSSFANSSVLISAGALEGILRNCPTGIVIGDSITSPGYGTNIQPSVALTVFTPPTIMDNPVPTGIYCWLEAGPSAVDDVTGMFIYAYGALGHNTTTVTGLFIQAAHAQNGTATNLVALQLNSFYAGTVSTISLLIDDVAGGPNNARAIKTGIGPVDFGDIVLTPASTTSRASLRIPHGAAPSSPVNGDVWTTTAGMFVRINGVTKSVNLT